MKNFRGKTNGSYFLVIVLFGLSPQDVMRLFSTPCTSRRQACVYRVTLFKTRHRDYKKLANQKLKGKLSYQHPSLNASHVCELLN